MTNILIAEDDETLLGLYSEVLEAIDIFHVPAIARNGEELLELLEEMKNKGEMADVILMDQRLPGKYGIELIPEIRRICDDVKIIIVSGDDRIGERAIKAGADFFLLKPFGIDQLVAAVKSVMGESGRKP